MSPGIKKENTLPLALIGFIKNNMIPLRATSIKDENAGGIFI